MIIDSELIKLMTDEELLIFKRGLCVLNEEVSENPIKTMFDIDEAVNNHRFQYVKNNVAFAKQSFIDTKTNITYEFTMDTVLDVLNKLVQKEL